MLLRLWIFLVLTLAGVLAPSRACARVVETRTGDFFAATTEARPKNAPQVADWHQANPLFNYEPASGYAQAAESRMFSMELGGGGPRASGELLDAMRAHGRTITIATEGTEELRFLNAVGAEASVGGPGRLNILLRENPSQAAAIEEFLHGTQTRLGIVDRLGEAGAEAHVESFMTRYSKLLGLEK